MSLIWIEPCVRNGSQYFARVLLFISNDFLPCSAVVALFLRDYHSLDFSVELVRDKRVFITGASRGIGRQAALHYARLGAKIVITGRDEVALKKVTLASLDGMKMRKRWG